MYLQRRRTAVTLETETGQTDTRPLLYAFHCGRDQGNKHCLPDDCKTILTICNILSSCPIGLYWYTILAYYYYYYYYYTTTPV